MDRNEKAIHLGDFGFNIAVSLLEQGQIIKQRNSSFGYKLVPNMAYGSEEFLIAIVNEAGKILSYTNLNVDQLLAKDWQVMADT